MSKCKSSFTKNNIRGSLLSESVGSLLFNNFEIIREDTILCICFIVNVLLGSVKILLYRLKCLVSFKNGRTF